MPGGYLRDGGQRLSRMPRHTCTGVTLTGLRLNRLEPLSRRFSHLYRCGKALAQLDPGSSVRCSSEVTRMKCACLQLPSGPSDENEERLGLC